MRTGTDRVLTTHTGSLPRPASGDVADVVDSQLASGVDVVGDGEVGKPSYATYVTERLTGFGEPEQGAPFPIVLPDRLDFPAWAADRTASSAAVGPAPCVGPVAYVDEDVLRAQLDAFRAALDGRDGVAEAFVTAASPGVIARFQPNHFYAAEEDYLTALADAMKTEYDAIVAAGFVLQLDCPDLTFGWHARDGDLTEHRRGVAERLAVLDHATRDVPPDRLRMHVCWGNYDGPHTHDLPLRDLIDLLLGARPSGISFEAANPRHEHEWTVFDEVTVPDDIVLIPGVIDSTRNYVEHPELVAQRIRRFTERVGTARVLAGSDCGFATFGARPSVHPEVTWAKLAALAEGAARA
jgi:5-methyltetrahydropteroyltriglutamate--homocysteine methyltransferase